VSRAARHRLHFLLEAREDGVSVLGLRAVELGEPYDALADGLLRRNVGAKHPEAVEYLRLLAVDVLRRGLLAGVEPFEDALSDLLARREDLVLV
jgi:hypothetical protein